MKARAIRRGLRRTIMKERETGESLSLLLP